jgi:precorrin-2 dehydrogenase / sirohydrochlorin ferrochelatase
VFACATPDVNAQVVADARARGAWVNAASDPSDGDFALPAVVRRGDFVLAVGTGGASPGLARRVREKLEVEYDDAFGAWVQLLSELRTEVLATIPDPGRRRDLLDGFADWRWLALVRAEGVEAARTAMRAALGSGG